MLFRVVWDQPETCPYREGELARLPLRLPSRRLTGEEFDTFLEEGDRRSGRMLYRTRCPSCNACQPLRVPAAEFTPTRSQRRIWKKNIADITVQVVTPSATETHHRLYNRHKLERGLSTSGKELPLAHYSAWVVDTCVDTREFQYRLGDELLAVTIVDLGKKAASSVYHYFDPDHGERSLGVFSVLWEIDWCRQNGVDWYYLGYYVEDCRHLAYKAAYFPHEKRSDGRWERFLE